MKIVVRAPITSENLEKLKQYFDDIVYFPWDETGKRFYEQEMIAYLTTEKPDAIITELDVINAQVLEKYSDLQFIADCRATPENIDVASCNELGIPVLCTPARNANAVAEMWLSTLIAFERNLLPSIEWVKEGKWVSGTTPYHLWMGHELYKKKIGFVGFGAVARRIAKLLSGFEVDICYYDPFVVSDEFSSLSLEDIFETCHCVSIHLPVNDQTQGLIDEKLLSRMNQDTVFINSARSAVVDNEYLYHLLKNKKIKGAILDVLDTEPPKEADYKFIDLPNVLLTPHTYGATYEVVDHQSDIILSKIQAYFAQERLADVVYNFKQIENRL